MKSTFICFLCLFFYLGGNSTLSAATLLSCTMTLRQDKEVISEQVFETKMVDNLFHLDSSKKDGHLKSRLLSGKENQRFQLVAAAMAADAKHSVLDSLAISDLEKKLKARASGVQLLEMEDLESKLRADVLCQFVTDSDKQSHKPE